MDKYKVEISDVASARRVEIFNYIRNSLQSPQAAANTIKEIDRKMLKLDILPDMHNRVKINGISNLRYVNAKNYNIYYRVDNKANVVTVVTIQYCSRNINSFLADL